MPSTDASPINLADHEMWARDRMDPALNAIIHGGAGDEITLRANEQAWKDLSLWPRVLAGHSLPSLEMDLLGRRWPTPVAVAPMAQQGRLHPDGERAVGLAASALGVGMVLSMQSNHPMEQIAQDVISTAHRGPLWFQLYHLGDRSWSHDLLHRAAVAGYEAVVVTVDAPIQGVRDRERRHPSPPMLGLTQPHMPAACRPGQDLATLLESSATRADIEWLIQSSPLPVLLKGILHPEDARWACACGAQGIIVSNHGGRVLDTVPATAVVLPLIVESVNGQLPVLVDGGIRRGTDILKALAMGAGAVLVGRPVAHGLFNAGAQGVAHVLRLLMDELQAAMALCGVSDMASVTNRLLFVKKTSKLVI